MSDDEGDAQLRVVIRPTRGSEEKFTVSVNLGASVFELKEAVAEKGTVSAAEQRLIYKGKILKDHLKVTEYGAQPDIPVE